MKLILRKSDVLDDWYVIERAEHDNRTWFEQTEPNVMVFRSSARISDADVEGTSAEMLEIAEAIKKRERTWFKRCAVRVDGCAAYFHSPRNSSTDGVVPLEDADELADEILRTLRPVITE